jgi:hypothetical protein
MRTIITFAVLTICLVLNTSFSQSIKGIQVSDLKHVEYIQITQNFRPWGRYDIIVDFGHDRTARVSSNESRSNTFLDANGDMVVLLSIITTLNYFYQLGFELNKAYVAAYDEN